MARRASVSRERNVKRLTKKAHGSAVGRCLREKRPTAEPWALVGALILRARATCRFRIP